LGSGSGLQLADVPIPLGYHICRRITFRTGYLLPDAERSKAKICAEYSKDSLLQLKAGLVATGEEREQQEGMLN